MRNIIFMNLCLSLSNLKEFTNIFTHFKVKFYFGNNMVWHEGCSEQLLSTNHCEICIKRFRAQPNHSPASSSNMKGWSGWWNPLRPTWEKYIFGKGNNFILINNIYINFKWDRYTIVKD